jgi:glycine dehydrogenase
MQFEGMPSNPLSQSQCSVSWLDSDGGFALRHIGPGAAQRGRMLEVLGVESLDALIGEAIPEEIRYERSLAIPEAASEHEALAELRGLASENRVYRNFIGQGYSGCHTPPVILRNILENPAWYTAYTPYQAEIAQGRLEALLNFQTMVCDLSGLQIANASLLDEGTAAAEAMSMALAACKRADARTLWVDWQCHPQTLEVVRTRAEALGLNVVCGDPLAWVFDGTVFAILLQVPGTSGTIEDFSGVVRRANEAGVVSIVAADLLSLTLLRPPGEWGADIVVGSAQRFGVPMGFGGPHAGFMATRDALKRLMPGRLVGVSRDAEGRPAYRLSLQTREQHIRRDKATSNICTAQVLLAVMASMYAVYHGPEGLKAIARRVHRLALVLASGLRKAGCTLRPGAFFDTVCVRLDAGQSAAWIRAAEERGINLRRVPEGVAISVDETTTLRDVAEVLQSWPGAGMPSIDALIHGEAILAESGGIENRTSPFLMHPVFHSHRTETEMLRYIRSLEAKDLSLVHSMIPLGSCTMKLNATSEMLPVSWPEFANLHPFCPARQSEGYRRMCTQLEGWLAEITGFAGVSLEPNAGSQGEYAGLLAIRAYHRSRGDSQREVCLIPLSAHGTNPASAVMAGMRVVAVECESNGDIDLEDLRKKVAAHGPNLAALMVTYPSTHGVFEEGIREICELIHQQGGQVYMDGANMNAQVGLCRPGDFGADVCHLNLHKTFCIPHGGGGPGVGPIGVAAHLVPFLPSRCEGAPVGAVSAAPYGSAGILAIPWMYIRMMGSKGLAEATKVAILNANYISARLDPYFPVLFKGKKGRVAHECILDLRGFKQTTAEDVAKRLMDFGFHSPTLSWPVAGTLMVEPTESESLAELDRFCEAMIAIHGEIQEVESGRMDARNNPLKNAPHTCTAIAASDWNRPYTREAAAFPLEWVRSAKFWPAVSRIDNVWGDRNLFCSCVPLSGE